MKYESPSNDDEPAVAGLLAEYDGPAALKSAAEGMRAEGYARLEAYSPYPVHGLRLPSWRRRSMLPWLALIGGVAGCAGALLLQWWTNAVDYPYWISGKPYFSLPANVPIAFELVILLGALAAFFGALALANLPELHHPLFEVAEFRRATTDAFFLSVDAADPRFDESATAELLRVLGARGVVSYRRSSARRGVPGTLKAAAALLAALALLPPLGIAQMRFQPKESPRIHPVLDMDFQPKYLPQQGSPLFADGRDMRPPVAGAVAADARLGESALLDGMMDGKAVAQFPLPVAMERMRRGRQRYDIFCAACHGLAGDGDGLVALSAFERGEPKWVRPLSLHDEAVVEQPVGRLYQTISAGIRTMPSYRSQIPVEDRWAIALYVRALQRSRNASMKDVPEEYRRELEKAQGREPTPKR